MLRQHLSNKEVKRGCAIAQSMRTYDRKTIYTIHIQTKKQNK